jgi:NAD(P)-dependent dehydrogenase (short-subunit alcohol dehydrogenase family)
MATRFSGQTFLITGGTSGIGLATAKRIAAEGGKVLVTGSNKERLEAAARVEGVHAFQSDVSKPEAAKGLAAEARRLFGELDGVFLNAGVAIYGSLSEITPEDYRRLFDVNVGGVVFSAQALAPLVKAGGSVLLMASQAKTKGVPMALLYAASKGAVRSIALVLARDLKERGIRVNSISPGPIATSFHDLAPGDPERTREIEAMITAMIPMGRFGRVEEAVAVATFLLSSDSSFVTGADYAVDGGEGQL